MYYECNRIAIKTGEKLIQKLKHCTENTHTRTFINTFTDTLSIDMEIFDQLPLNENYNFHIFILSSYIAYKQLQTMESSLKRIF